MVAIRAWLQEAFANRMASIGIGGGCSQEQL
jgi:hypothetical protein